MTTHRQSGQRPVWRPGVTVVWLTLAAVLFTGAHKAGGQDYLVYRGDPIPPKVEAVYAKGLAWLVKNQNADGCWSGQYGSDPGAVGAAVLAMLAHGDDPNLGIYSEAIKKGIHFILNKANVQNGYIGQSMYNHGFATLALAEAYGSVNDPRIGPALKKAVDFILSTQMQNAMNAWRYTPESDDADTTVSGAQVVALLAARNAGLEIPDKAIKKALAYFYSCQSGDGGFGYTGGQGAMKTTSAIGTLVLALAKLKSTEAFKAAVRCIEDADAGSTMSENYHVYYYSQALFHGNMNAWGEWNIANVAKLAESQSDVGAWSGNEGPAFATSAALLSLALNYRYLPIYER